MVVSTSRSVAYFFSAISVVMAPSMVKVFSAIVYYLLF